MATKKTSQVMTLQLDGGDAAMVDIGKMLGPTGINTRQLKAEYDEATASRRALGATNGSVNAGTQPLGTLDREQLRDIAVRKLPDLNTAEVAVAMRQVAGTTRSMGVRVDGTGG